jgi:2-polyprenyl-6-methoxyphenol hydroxylase-like FAD-dependent oxidoreductase
MFRRGARALVRKSNRYVDGTGRKLDPAFRHQEHADLYEQPLNDPALPNGGYPIRNTAWHPAVVNENEPKEMQTTEEMKTAPMAADMSMYRGNAVVVGAGIGGATAGLLLALRGWFVTLIEQHSRDVRLAGGLETALATKRVVDVLHAVGVRKEHLKAIGSRVVGIMEHPGTVNSWLSAGLKERHDFALNMLAIDLPALNGLLHRAVDTFPHASKNVKVFHDHRLVALLPEAKKAVVKPLRMHERGEEDQAASGGMPKGPMSSLKDVVINGMRFDDNLEGLDYDVIIGADGVNSDVRRLAKIDDSKSVHRDWYVSWFCVTGATHLEPDYVHRWSHKFSNSVNAETINLGLVMAYPRGQTGTFAVMVYFPKPMMDEHESATSFAAQWAPDLLKEADGSAPSVMPDAGTWGSGKAHPTIFCERMHNTFYSRNTNVVLLGDAGHLCNPFLQQNLALTLEDAAMLADHFDYEGRQTLSRRAQLYSDIRGPAGDALRNITVRSLYYERRKHWNPLLRLRNDYSKWMHALFPRSENELFPGSYNYFYSRSLEQMLNGRGYNAYTAVDASQYNANRWWAVTRTYT